MEPWEWPRWARGLLLLAIFVGTFAGTWVAYNALCVAVGLDPVVPW